MNFAKAMNTTATTANGAMSYTSPDPSGGKDCKEGRISIFFKGVRGLSAPQLYEYLKVSAKENLTDTFILTFQLRDCRGGKGERDLGRKAMTWLFINYPNEFRKVLPLVGEYGRYDDYLFLFPRVLKLDDPRFVRENYLSSVESLFEARSLQNDVVLFLANKMKEDLVKMKAGESCSLCSKWMPTEGDSLDAEYGVFKTLATALKTSPKNLRVRYNTPLRAYLNIIERLMCGNKWEDIDFSKVPSCAMKKLKKAFQKHDEKRFLEWKGELKSGNTKVNAKVLYPHEIVKEMRKENKGDELLEAQWKVLVDEVRSKGKMKDVVAVIDTSSSMSCNDYLPLDVAVAMGLIISEVVDGPFQGHLISFNSNPKFTVIPDVDLFSRFKRVRDMDWGGSTNLEGTFKLILERGKKCGLTQEDMPKTLIICSDMEFNMVSGSQETNMERINSMYKTAGYERPKIVFWNLNGASKSFPITVDENNTAMISGFSPSILKSILYGDEFSPYSIMRNALDDTRYDMVKKAFVADPSVVDPNVADSSHVGDLKDDFEIVD